MKKIKILEKNGNFDEKLKFLWKIEVLVKNLNLGEQSKFWRKIEILVKNQTFGGKIKNHNENFSWKKRSTFDYQSVNVAKRAARG